MKSIIKALGRIGKKWRGGGQPSMLRLVKRLNKQEAAAATQEQKLAIRQERQRLAAIISREGVLTDTRLFPMFGGSEWYNYQGDTYCITYWGDKVEQIAVGGKKHA